jgi:hypothetical protein
MASTAQDQQCNHDTQAPVPKLDEAVPWRSNRTGVQAFAARAGAGEGVSIGSGPIGRNFLAMFAQEVQEWNRMRFCFVT